ncbi:Flagellar protein FlgJ [peptidoglycan hydrolase], partial [hydrothermal vent metagenome]
SIKEVAKQFEALFVQMMLKSMRDTIPENELFGSEAEKTYQDMYDKQLTKQISNGRGIGLAETIERQLGGNPDGDLNNKSINEYISKAKIRNAITSALHNNESKKSKVKNDVPFNLSSKQSMPVVNLKTEKNIEFNNINVNQLGDSKNEKNKWNSAKDFVQDIRPHANRVAKKLGVNPNVLVAQSALETGWGKYAPKNIDGSNSFNVFGIKADERWQGDTVIINTREVRHGVMQQEKAAFRSYESVAQAFDDYANFILESPRYQQALTSTEDENAYAQALQKAGYATDPNYAEKINRIRMNELVQNQPKATLLKNEALKK